MKTILLLIIAFGPALAVVLVQASEAIDKLQNRPHVIAKLTN